MNRHNDLIRLIDAVWLLCKKTCTPGIACPDAICCEMWEEFKDIPSVDAVQVIRCRDCKYWMPYDWMFSEVWKSKNMEDYPEN